MPGIHKHCSSLPLCTERAALIATSKLALVLSHNQALPAPGGKVIKLRAFSKDTLFASLEVPHPAISLPLPLYAVFPGFSYLYNDLSPHAPAMPPPCLMAGRFSLLMKFILRIADFSPLCTRPGHLCLFVTTDIMIKSGEGFYLPWGGYGVFCKGYPQQGGGGASLTPFRVLCGSSTRKQARPLF